MDKGKLIIITGFSGAGKDSITNLLLEKRKDISKIVTYTNRPPRPHEIEGFDYHFVSTEVFESMINNNSLIEYVLYGSHYKGTSKEDFDKVLKGQNLIWRIDMSRAAVIEELFTETYEEGYAQSLISRTIKIMIKPPTNKIAFQRYLKRDGKKADIEEFKKRTLFDRKVFKDHLHKFPHIITNEEDKLHETLDNILKILDKV